jgi:multidrug transporter EmrE-like cation transporter
MEEITKPTAAENARIVYKNWRNGFLYINIAALVLNVIDNMLIKAFDLSIAEWWSILMLVSTLLGGWALHAASKQTEE